MPDPPLLEYRAPSPRSAAKPWMRRALTGIIAGVAIAFSGFAMLCFAPLGGFVVGGLATLGASSRTQKFLFGILGVCLCITTILVIVTLINAYDGFGPTTSDSLPKLGLIAGLVGLPGLFGSALMTALDDPPETRP